MTREEFNRTVALTLFSFLVPKSAEAAIHFLKHQESTETNDIEQIIANYYQTFDIKTIDDLDTKESLGLFTDLNSREKTLSPLTLLNLTLNQTIEAKETATGLSNQYIQKLRKKEERILRARLEKALRNIRQLPTSTDQIIGSHVTLFLESKELLSFAATSLQTIKDNTDGANVDASKTIQMYDRVIQKARESEHYKIIDQARDKWPEKNYDASWSRRVVLRKERIAMVELVRGMILDQFQSETLKRDMNKILFLVNHESAGFNPDAHSPTTAVGLFQIVKGTWRKVNRNLRHLANNNLDALRKNDPVNATKWINIKNDLPQSLLQKMSRHDYSDLANRINPGLNAFFGLSLYLAEGDVHWRFGEYWRWSVPGERGDIFTYEEIP